MAAEYRVDIKSRLGVLQVQSVDFLELHYSKRVNEPGECRIVWQGDSAAADYLGAVDEDNDPTAHEAQIEIWRRDTARGLDWAVDFYAFHMGEEWNDTTTSNERFTSIGIGQMALLDWDIIRAGGAASTEIASQPAETAMKEVAGAWNDGGGRYDHTLTIEADAGGGSTTSGLFVWQTVLAALQDIATAVGVAQADFDLAKTGAFAWEFRYRGLLGTDRSATVRFSQALGNMARRRYRFDRSRERNAYQAVYSFPTPGASGINGISGSLYGGSSKFAYLNVGGPEEMLSSSSNSQRATAAYRAQRALPEIEFDVLQTNASAYGLHYALGDLVTVDYHGERTMQIAGAHVSYARSNPRETIRLELRPY